MSLGMISTMYSVYQETNPEGSDSFNNDLIYAREKDNIADYIKDIFKSLEVVEGIIIEDIEFTDNEMEFNYETAGFNKVDYSRLSLVKVHIRVNFEEDEKIVVELYVPKLVDDFFFYLNGSTYFPIFQIIDRGTYTTKRQFTLKTMLLPLSFKTDINSNLICENDSSYENTPMIFNLNIFNATVNPLLYYYSKMGYNETFEFFGITEYFNFYQVDTKEDLNQILEIDPSTERVFKITNKLFIGVDTEWMSSSTDNESLAVTVVNSFNKVKISDLEADDTIFWLKRLSKYFTKSQSKLEEKGAKILNSFEGIVEGRTQKNLAYLPPEYSENTYNIVKWMMTNYSELSAVDNMDLTTKRIRISEYIIHGLLLKYSDNRYRLINSRKKTQKSMVGIFKYLSPMYIINQLVKNELLHYSNNCNQHDLFTAALKWTITGRQAAGNKSDIGLQYRGLHPSYLGRIGLSNASAGSPGTTGMFTPFAETDGQYFTKDEYDK